MANENWTIEAWWTPFQIPLVKDTSRVWIRKEFKSTSGFWKQVDGGKLLGKTSGQETLPPDATVDSTAWDHEHCELCFETISDRGDYQNEGYTDGKEWLCITCFNKYIAPPRPLE